MRTAWIPGGDWAIPQSWGCTSYTAEPDCSICAAACNCRSGHFHNGIDITIPVGTPIVAAVACTLTAIGNDSANPYFGFGRNYPILNINGTQFLFGHTRDVVGPPRGLQPGEVFAHSGEEGSPGAPHTHAQANRVPGHFQDSIDPVPFLLLGGDDLANVSQQEWDELVARTIHTDNEVNQLKQALLEGKDYGEGHDKGYVAGLVSYIQDDRQKVADATGRSYAKAVIDAMAAAGVKK